MCLFIVHSYFASKLGKKEKIYKENHSNHSLIAGLNLSSYNVRNCKETTTFVKECETNIECLLNY